MNIGFVRLALRYHGTLIVRKQIENKLGKRALKKSFGSFAGNKSLKLEQN